MTQNHQLRTTGMRAVAIAVDPIQRRDADHAAGSEAPANDHRRSFAFSSEATVQRDWYGEILDHSPESIRIGQRQANLPLLYNHDRDDLLGVVERVWLEDRRLHCEVRFATDERGAWAEKMVNDGILRNVSFLYQVFDMKPDDSGTPDAPVYRALDWEVYEVSLVTIPADETVGIGRMMDPPEASDGKEAREAQIEVEVNMTEKSHDDLMREERSRTHEIMALCEKHSMERAFCEKAIEQGWSVDQVRSAVLDTITAARAAKPAADLTADMSRKERAQYSLVRAISMASRGEKLDGLEREVSDELRKRMGLADNGGFFVPSQIGSRAWTGTDNLIATEHHAEEFVSYLRERSVLANLGARVMSGLVGDVEIPTMTAGAAVSWGKDADGTVSDATFGTIKMSQKQATALMTIPRSMLLQASPDIEQILRDDLFGAMAEAVDNVALNGTGSTQPTGLLSASGTNTIALGTNGGLITWDSIIDMETKVREAKIRSGNFGYLVNPGTLGFLKKLKDTTDRPLWVPGLDLNRPDTLNGYRIEDSTLVPSNLTKGTATTKCSALIFGAWDQLLVGEWAAVEIMLNPFGSAFASGGTQIRAIQHVDVAVRRGAAFSIIKDFDPTATK